MKRFLFIVFSLSSLSLARADITISANAGAATLPLPPGDTNYIQNTGTLQKPATYYVEKGTVQGIAPDSGGAGIGATDGLNSAITATNGTVSYSKYTGAVSVGNYMNWTWTFKNSFGLDEIGGLIEPNVTASGVAQITTDLDFYIRQAGSTKRALKLRGSDLANVSKLIDTSTTTFNGVTYNWPITQGAANTYPKNDGSGNLSWVTIAAGGSSSSLAVGTGTASNFTTNLTSPTAVISALGSQFSLTTNGTTSFWQLNSASVTLSGPLSATSPLTLTGGNFGITAVSLSTGVTSSLPAASIAAGNLGGSVVASSIAVAAVQDASIVAVGGAKITGTATIPNAAIDGSSITKQGVIVANSPLTITGNNTIGLSAISLSSAVTGSLPAASIAAGSLGASVLASSLPANVAYKDESSTDSFSFSISTAGWNNMVFAGPALDWVNGSTVTLVQAETMPLGSTITFSLQYRGFGLLNSSGTNYFNVTNSTANSDGKIISSFTAVSGQGLVPGNGSLDIVTAGNASAGSAATLRVDVFCRKKRT